MMADNLENLLDSLSETSVYVIEEATHHLLYFNKRCRETGRQKAAIGIACHTVWPEVCANCPLDALGDRSSSHIVCYDPLMKTTVDVTANRIIWDGNIHAVVVTATPHRLNFEEEQGLQKIEQMYAQSLVTVFDECIIVNLTGDYYVNCQKDVVWNGIPERGNFGIENRHYAQKALHPDDLEIFNQTFSREAMLALFASGKKQITRRLRRLTKDNTYHMVEFTAARIDRFGEDECWCVLVFRDIQDAFLLEQQRNMEISQLATAAQTAYQMLIAVNLTENTYHMLEYNRKPIKMPGNAGCFNDLIESELSTVHPDYREDFINKFSRKSLMDTFSGSQRIVMMEVPHIGEDGNYHWHFTQVVRVDSPYTDDLIEITLSRNIDEERQKREESLEKERQAKLILEEALQKAENASQAKSDFLSRMSHDIRTPMNTIVGMTELAMRHVGDETKTKDYLLKIAGSGAHLLSLINEVLDVSKIESGSVELAETAFNLRDLVYDAVEMVNLPVEEKRQSLLVDISDKLDSQVLGDARRLKQVLVNILENASKYTHEEGRIMLSLNELKGNESGIGTYVFTIEDNGIGMKPSFLEHIFEPFSREDDSRTSKVPGTGLGMTIVKSLVSMMGGDIQVESQYGKGSLFRITLCLTKTHKPAITPSKPHHTEETFDELRILLVEDNELNRQIATEMMNLLGAEVEVAENGLLALNAVTSHPPFYYDMVFMDIQMPVMNGYEAAKAIRHSGMEYIDELPIVAMTADAFAEDVKQSRLAGMNGHLAKPISIKQLKKVLLTCLEWKRSNRHGRFPEDRV